MSRRKSSGDLLGNLCVGIIFSPILLIIGAIYVIIWIITWIIDMVTSGKSTQTKHRYQFSYSEDDMAKLAQIDNMSGYGFESFITDLLKKNGFSNVYTTKSSGDHGADVIGELNGIKYAFQCKRSESKIGVKPIGEVLRGMNHYQCPKGVIITNNYFTPQAQMESKVNNVELWDRRKVLSLCKSVEKKDGNSIVDSKELKNDASRNIGIGILVGIVILIILYFYSLNS